MDSTENQHADIKFAWRPDPQALSDSEWFKAALNLSVIPIGIMACMLKNCDSNYSGHYRQRAKRKERTFQKRFVVPWSVLKSVGQRLLDGVNQCNSCKFGRLQRGEVSLTEVVGSDISNGLCELILTFVIGRPRYKYLIYRDGNQHACRREGVRGDYDYRPVLRIIGKAAAKVAKRTNLCHDLRYNMGRGISKT